MLVFVRVRRQQHALVLVHIVFCVKEIMGNSLENQLVKTGCIGVAYAVDNYIIRVIHVETFFYCQTSVHPCIGKRRTHHLYCSLYFAFLSR